MDEQEEEKKQGDEGEEGGEEEKDGPAGKEAEEGNWTVHVASRGDSGRSRKCRQRHDTHERTPAAKPSVAHEGGRGRACR